MKILMITGSPHKKGTSAFLADEFIRGAKDAGHEIKRFDAAFMKVHGCIGCNHCIDERTTCIFKDDMDLIYPEIVTAEQIVIVSPIYYWGLTSQIKAVIDRLQPIVFSIIKNKKVFFITTQTNEAKWVTEPLDVWYNNLIRFMQWIDKGRIHALGCPTREVIEKTDYPQQAYNAGKNIQIHKI